MNHLQNSVDQLLRSNRELAGRIRGLEKEGSIISRHRDEDSHLAASYRTSQSCKSHLSRSNSTKSARFAFEEDLKSSRAYRIVYCEARIPLHGSALCDSALSVFSKMSIDRVSCIAVYALPVYSEDIHNHQWYTFGDIGAEIALETFKNSADASIASSLQPANLKSPKKTLSKNGILNSRSISSQNVFQGKKKPPKSVGAFAHDSLDYLLLIG